MKDILVRSGLCGVVMLGMFSCAVSIQANDEDNARVSIQGRDVFLDGRPHIPHGMVHAANEHFPSLSKIGINSIHEDVAFRDFDPRRSDEENKAALARYLKKADEAHANGMTMLWLFSFHYTPDWLWERYPDAHAKKQDGSDGQGGWISMCLDHPGFRTDAAAWLKFVASNLGSHPATLGYLLWNEPPLTSEICYNAHTIAAFHKWLEKCYQTVETMNKAWQAQFAAFTDVKPPAPQARTRWHEVYDKMVSEQADAEAQNAPVATDNPAVSMDWLRFRQDNFAEFFAWEADVVRAADPDAVITSKIVPFDLYTSHAYGAGVNTELWERKFLDVIGMDLYSHLDEDFLARWKCDYFLSLSQGKPVWHTEFNFTFLKERGLATPEQWRTVAYYQLARGVNGFWDFMWGDGEDYTLHYNGYRFAPVTHEIARISRQLEKLAPLLVGARPAPAQVAVLHSTTSGLAVSGDYAPSADQTTIIDLLYRSHTPFEFVTEDMVRRGDLKKYRALITVGTIALPDDVLSQIRKFTDENGGHVFANARFAELDDYGRKRTQYPPAWMGVKANSLSRQPREKTGTLELRRGARSVDDNPVDVRVTMDTWSSRPIKLASGEALGSGNIFGDEDTQFEWSCGGRHEMYWEDVQAINGGKVTGTFEAGKPAIVETPQTLYIARDTCWVDENFERFFGRFLKRSGVLNRNAVTRAGTGEPVPSVDLRMWEGKDTRVLFVINSAPTLHYDGEPVDVEVTFDSFGEVTDALTGQLVPSRWRDFKRVIRLELKAGDVRVLLGKPRPASWGADQSRYNDLNEHLQPNAKPYVAWRRSPTELWVYDARSELGMGMHGTSRDALERVKTLGVRIVRHTVYWHNIEKTDKPGVYDQEALARYDGVIARAKEADIELLLLLHGNPPGTGWENREEGYQRFAEFARFLVERYPSVRFWELWNEMDLSFTDLFGAERPGYPLFERGRCYAQMLKLVYPAIKGANPKAWVLIGGIAAPPSEFIRGIYEEGGRDTFDFMNIHTYGVPLKWRMITSGYEAKLAMAGYGDFNRPIWNTEFGIDAGNLWEAWKVSTAEGFDEGHLNAWKSSITEAMAQRIYAQILPYQFHSGNGRECDQEAAGIQLPVGHTMDDYGFGLVRRDGKTPRPTYNWLLAAQVNSRIQEEPVQTCDVTVGWDGTWEPAGYLFEASGKSMTIKDVEIDSLEPTAINLQPTN